MLACRLCLLISVPWLLLMTTLDTSMTTSVKDKEKNHTFKPTIDDSNAQGSSQSHIIDKNSTKYLQYDGFEITRPYNTSETLNATKNIYNETALHHFVRRFVPPTNLYFRNEDFLQQLSLSYDDYNEAMLSNPNARHKENFQASTHNQKLVKMNHLCLQNGNQYSSLFLCGDELRDSFACLDTIYKKVTPCKELYVETKLAFLCILKEQPKIVVECGNSRINFCFATTANTNQLVFCQNVKDRVCFQNGAGLQHCAKESNSETETKHDESKPELFIPTLRILKRRSSENYNDTKSLQKYVHCSNCEVDIDLIVDKSKPGSPPKILVHTKHIAGYNYTHKG